MREKFEGIVLNIRKYNDRNIIVTAYSKNHGNISFISPTGSGKGAAVRRAHLQPLSYISSDITYKPGADLNRLGSVSLCEVWNDIYFHPVKRLISFFISEFLYRFLKASMEEPQLWDFIVDSIRLLDRMKKNISDFHIVFLISLLHFSGIQPDIKTYRNGYVFDYASGSFVHEQESKGPSLKGEEAYAVTWVSRINFSNIAKIKLSTNERRRLLSAILNYYSYHFPGLSGMKSLEILQEIQ